MAEDRARALLAALFASAALGWAAGPVLAAPAADGRSLLAAVRDETQADIGGLLRRPGELNARDEYGSTPLAWAVLHNNATVAKVLLDAGADPNLTDVNGIGPLALAVGSDRRDIVAMLLDKGANPNTARNNGETPLMTAAHLGSADAVKVLLAHGADVNAKEGRFGQTALMWATGHPEIVRILLDKGADIRAVTKTWTVGSADYAAVFDGKEDAPLVSLKAGGQNALMSAVLKNDIDSTRMLLDAGLDVNQPAADGATPLIAALYHWNSDPKKLVRIGFTGGVLDFAPDLKIANLLLDRGAKANVADQTGITPLHGALLSVTLGDRARGARLTFPTTMRSDLKRARPKLAEHDDAVIALVQRLLQGGADPNAAISVRTAGPAYASVPNPLAVGSTPYHIAAASHNPQLVGLLAEHGGDPNRVRADGHTPFSVAVMNNDLPTVQLLVAKGADLQRSYDPTDKLADPALITPGLAAIRYVPRKNETIMHIAAAAASEWVAPYLAEKGARLDTRNNYGETPFDLAASLERYRYLNDIVIGNALLANGISGLMSKPAQESATSDVLKGLMAANSKMAGKRQHPTTVAQAASATSKR